jgi:hypothetical protein
LLKFDGTVPQDSPWLGSTDRYETSAKVERAARLWENARNEAAASLKILQSLSRPDEN